MWNSESFRTYSERDWMEGFVMVSSVIHTDLPIEALMGLLQIVLMLYPPYVLFTIIHHECIKRRIVGLSEKLIANTIETKMRVAAGRK